MPCSTPRTRPASRPQHGPALYDFARHVGVSHAEAADAVQEALLRLWRELRRGTHIETPLGWTYRTCYRLAMSQHRWRRQLGRLSPSTRPQPLAYAGPEIVGIRYRCLARSR